MQLEFKKYSIYFKYLSIVLSIFACSYSLADEVITPSNIQQTVENSSLANPEPNSETSRSAPVTAVTENAKLIPASSTPAIANKAISTKSDNLSSKGSLKNPYALLVNLAFKGKNASGVRDYSEALVIYCRGARDGDANAQYAMGWLYENGRGVVQDNDIAAMFYTKAAAQNHTNAIEHLAEIKGNPAIAAMPVCMLPDPPPPAIVSNKAIEDQGELETVPFYTKGPIYKIVSKFAPRFKIEPDLAMAFIAVESGFNPQATSPKNAQGLMQLIPETAARFNVKNAYNPEDNIKGGLAYLQWLLAYFRGDIQLVAAAYNSGELTVEKYKGVPPYPETQNYVKKISSLYKKPYHPYQTDMGQSSSLFNLVADQPKLKPL